MANVIVTGGAGFIGRAVVRKLLVDKHTVRIVDNLSKGSYKKIANEEIIKLDLLNSKKTKQYFKGADYCIHLAAKIGGIGYFHLYPASILSENNSMLSSVFDASAENKIKRVVYISSSMVYESATHFPSKEDDTKKIPLPVTAYGFSKLIGEEYCKSYFDQYTLPYVIIRPFNAYGKFEFPGNEVGMAHVIPDLLKKIFSGQYPLELLGDGSQIRCFTHVDDIADGIVKAMDHGKSLNQTFNIAHPEPISMEDLAKKLWKFSLQQKPLKITYMKGFSDDVKKRIPDTKKAQTLLGWRASIAFDKGLMETVEWYRSLYE